MLVYPGYPRYPHQEERIRQPSRQEVAQANMERAEKAQKINRIARDKLAEMRGSKHRSHRLGGEKRLWRFAKRAATREVNGLRVPKPKAFVEIGGKSNHVADKKPRKRAVTKNPAKARAR